ncbi:hypothetical protein DFJ58DRAFT_730185 [Suillus subalutaceus]|uniref:uncharacterized protein n=1 Tax=Suillus subalutaceus TaxID=48586 RepID=UPI001B87C09C|nr:uncharacterized protein DFJ58DRAFT_730185 [Suillus subalutaceus]KAG1847305.1 hypothetical protein DFJ58DRAFT_730185 [Suillus subalutaceus]
MKDEQLTMISGEYNDGPALTDSPPGGDGNELMEIDESQSGHNDGRTDTIPYYVLQHHQAKNGRRKAPSLTCLSSNSCSHTLTSNAFGRSKSPRQYSPKHIPRRRSPETRTSSTRLKPPQRAPRKGPSAKAGSAHGGRDPTSHGPSRRRSPTRSMTAFTRSRSPRSSRGCDPMSRGPSRQCSPTRSMTVFTRSRSPRSSRGRGHTFRRLSPSQYPPAQSTTIFTRSRSPHRSTSRGSSPGHSSLRPPDRRASQFNHSRSHTPVPSRSHSCTRSPTPESRNRDKPMNKQTNPSKLGFYPPCWQAFLQAAKLEMCLQAVLTHPVPEHQHVLQLAREVLDAVLWSYHSKKIKMENSYFPQYRAQMSRLLCDDLFTFRTELKKIVISITKQLYSIFPKANMGQKDTLQWHGKYKNFVSQVLKDACIDFYYGNGKKALKLTKEFRKTIPVNALILVSAVAKGILTGFRNTSTDKVSDLSADKCRSDFNSLRRSVDTLMDNSECRQELESMLEEWADVGMMGSDDVNIVL